jgi:hypothetical protein
MYTTWKWWTFNYYVYLILTVNTYLFKYVPVKLGFIILSLIGVLRIPEEFYLYKDKDKEAQHWADSVLLTFHFALRKLNTEQLRFVLAKQFQRRRFLESDKSKTRIARGSHVC